VVVLNKADLMDPETRDSHSQGLKEMFPNVETLLISAQKGDGLKHLGEELFSVHESLIESESFCLKIPYPRDSEAARFIHWVHEHTIVKYQGSEDISGVEHVVLELEVPLREREEFLRRSRDFRVDE